MEDKKINQICIIIIIIGLVAFFVLYKEEFEEKNINELLIQERNSKGKIIGKIEHVIKNYPTTNFIINDGTGKAIIYYPKETDFKKNDFITAFVEKEKENNLYAYKVIKET
ncbi:MAG: hypothetical protein GX950_01260 [Candidatus Diapherotrites archaeon]|jgi:hypothetical protein|uniref:Uncharacterized protein n=1 Tax=Candidatus Iainarchaeum sp. TaxID=3101447 RepID=A0A7K4BYZ8_9ARCH|nr:hypothetical protein [Candidatus Diapherotrites archaeon]